jgi:hypothetical protein
LLRTDHAGALQWRFRSDGRAAVDSWRSAMVRYWHNRPGEFLPLLTPDEDSSDAIDTNPAPPEPFFPG